MASREYFYPKSQAEWRSWLAENGKTKSEIWLLCPHKCTGKPHVPYIEALEEALCFGWIDGIVKRYDENTVSRRFSPRSKKTSWSEVNKHHVRLLIKSGKMTPAGMSVLPDLNASANPYPVDILDELRKDGVVWENFCAFPEYYRNIRIAAIENCRQCQEKFRKSLDYFIEQTRRNRRYGRFR
ncbi:MAG: YdeI/OmpD-associated family protein [Puniceicoccales bacterium]|jgi:hypothetical protein|nr:YdeI/OmpD-associated family protein [Puniceicoccales bacterium]